MEGPIPHQAAGDALHISIATAYACDYLPTWNCRHIANAEIQKTVGMVVKRCGFELPTICTPEELMKEQAHSRNIAPLQPVEPRMDMPAAN